jgi:hypothetical protein
MRLIAQGVDALIINAWDKDAIGPAVEKAAAEGIPMVGYDRLIEDDRTFYLTFDNKSASAASSPSRSPRPLSPTATMPSSWATRAIRTSSLPAGGHGGSDR